jgi:hypothetical protein
MLPSSRFARAGHTGSLSAAALVPPYAEPEHSSSEEKHVARNSKQPDAEAVEAAWGERMIEVRVRFWTNDLAEGKGQVRPRHAWEAGMVRMERNEAHGIAGGDPLPFQSLMDLPAVIEKLLIRDKIRLHPSTRTKKYHEPL